MLNFFLVFSGSLMLASFCADANLNIFQCIVLFCLFLSKIILKEPQFEVSTRLWLFVLCELC